MKNTLVRTISVSLATAALLMVVAVQNSIYAQDTAGSETDSQSADRLVGAWETIVTPRNCETGDQIAPSFAGVITFNEGGTIAEFGANPATPFRTPGHGVWSGGKHGNYTMRFSFLPLTPTGIPIGRLRVSQVLTLGRFSDESNSMGSFVLTNFSGVVIGTGCTTATAVRVN